VTPAPIVQVADDPDDGTRPAGVSMAYPEGPKDQSL